MGNICINILNAQGAPKQVDELVGKLSEYFEDNLDINDVFATEFKATASLSVYSQCTMPQKDLLEITRSLSDTQDLYIRVTAEEPAEEYFEQSVFTDGKWDFENPPSINSQIHELTSHSLEQIRQYIREKGNIDFGEDCKLTALYINDDGYAECPYYQCAELDENNKLSVLLSDGYWLYEDDLTTVHVMDILSLLFEEHECAE